jgi:hypothetical protein
MVRKAQGRDTTGPRLRCRSCRRVMSHVTAPEGLGLVAYKDSDGERRSSLLVELTDLSICCTHCGQEWRDEAGRAGERVRLIYPDDLPDGVELFDNRETLMRSLLETTREEIDLDYEMLGLDITLEVTFIDGWLELRIDVGSIEEIADIG